MRGIYRPIMIPAGCPIRIEHPVAAQFESQPERAFVVFRTPVVELVGTRIIEEGIVNLLALRRSRSRRAWRQGCSGG